MPREPWFVLFLYEKYAPASGPARVHRRRCGRHSEIRAQAFSAVLDHVVSMRDRERARDGSVNVLSQRTLRVFSDHKQETDSSTKGLVCFTHHAGKDRLWSPSLSPALHPLFSFVSYSCSVSRMCFCHASANLFCSGFPLGIQCTLLHFASAVDL